MHGICGKNVTVAEKEINIVCSCLDEIGVLPEDMVIDVLNGLTNCSISEFTKLFDFMLQATHVGVLDLDTDLDDNALSQIKMIMTKIVDVYHALYISGKWHINHMCLSLVVCWNYGEE